MIAVPKPFSFPGACALFEEDAGKMDWYHASIGKPKFVEFNSNKNVAYVATEVQIDICPTKVDSTL